MSARKTTEQFIEEMKEIFHDRDFDYSKVVYTSNRTNVRITCNEHQHTFEKSPNSLLTSKRACKYCEAERKEIMTEESFLKQAKEKFGDTYDYSKVDFIVKTRDVIIGCPVHGFVTMTPHRHLVSETGCPDCTGNTKKDTEQFVKEAQAIYPQYDYSKVEYINCRTPVEVICPEHGPKWVNPKEHIGAQRIHCHACTMQENYEKRKISTEQWIEKVLTKRPEFIDQFDYSFVNYWNDKTPVKIRCIEHDEMFEVQPRSHIKAVYGGCTDCLSNHHKTQTLLDSERFIQKSIDVFGDDTFIYDKVDYIDMRTEITLTCKEHSYTFSTTPFNHLRNTFGGCDECVKDNTSSYEKTTRNILENMEIFFIEQKTFENCKYKKMLPFDFYLPDLNILIECQGEGHYFPVNFGGISDEEAQENFELGQIRDQIKRDFCQKYDIFEVEVPYWEYKDGTAEDFIRDALNI